MGSDKETTNLHRQAKWFVISVSLSSRQSHHRRRVKYVSHIIWLSLSYHTNSRRNTDPTKTAVPLLCIFDVLFLTENQFHSTVWYLHVSTLTLFSSSGTMPHKWPVSDRSLPTKPSLMMTCWGCVPGHFRSCQTISIIRTVRYWSLWYKYTGPLPVKWPQYYQVYEQYFAILEGYNVCIGTISYRYLSNFHLHWSNTSFTYSICITKNIFSNF